MATNGWTGIGERFSLWDNSGQKVGYLGQNSQSWCVIVDESEAIVFDLAHSEPNQIRKLARSDLPYLGVSGGKFDRHRWVGFYRSYSRGWRWDGSSLFSLDVGEFLVALVEEGQPCVGTSIVAEDGAATVKLRLSTTE